MISSEFIFTLDIEVLELLLLHESGCPVIFFPPSYCPYFDHFQYIWPIKSNLYLILKHYYSAVSKNLVQILCASVTAPFIELSLLFPLFWLHWGIKLTHTHAPYCWVTAWGQNSPCWQSAFVEAFRIIINYMEKEETTQIKFNGKNYIAWSWAGKGLVGHLEATVSVPTDDKEQQEWHQNNSNVTTWVLNCIDPNLGLSLQSFSKASSMRAHLWNLYQQTNIAQKLYLHSELAKYGQGDFSAQEYYNGFLTLRTEHDSETLQSVPQKSPATVLHLQEESHIS